MLLADCYSVSDQKEVSRAGSLRYAQRREAVDGELSPVVDQLMNQVVVSLTVIAHRLHRHLQVAMQEGHLATIQRMGNGQVGMQPLKVRAGGGGADEKRAMKSPNGCTASRHRADTPAG